MSTEKNAWDAFAGESQANRKYANFAEKAEEEGFKNVARIFRAASEAEAIHAKKLLKVLSAVGSTVENLKGSIKGETHEFTEMYPSFIKEAESEKRNDAVIAFNHAMKAEEVHAGLYKEAESVVSGGKDLGDSNVWLCPVCGNVVRAGSPPEKCPICGAMGKLWREIK